MKAILTLLFLPALLLPALSYAAIPAPDWVYFSGQLGSIWKRNVQTIESEGTGPGTGISGGARYLQDGWLFDGELGWRRDRLSKNGISIISSAFTMTGDVQVVFAKHWAIGPSMTFLVGRDVSYSDTGTNSDKRWLTAFGGGKILREISFGPNQWNTRFGLEAQTDITIGGRQVTWVQMLFEMGLPWRDEATTSIAHQFPTTSAATTTDNQPSELTIYFAKNSVRVTTQAQHRLEDLAVALTTHSNQWTKAFIRAYTGESETMILKGERADAVKALLIKHGLAAEKLQLELASDDVAHEKLGSVYVVIGDVPPNSLLQRELNLINDSLP